MAYDAEKMVEWDEDITFFQFYKSLGLWWCREETGPICEGQRENVLHGPFMDLQDAFAQIDRPADSMYHIAEG